MFSRAFEKYLREEKLAGSMGRNDMTDSTGTPLYSQFPLSRQSSRAKTHYRQTYIEQSPTRNGS